MPPGKIQKTELLPRTEVRGSEPRGEAAAALTDSYQGDLCCLPQVQVNSPEAELGGWIELAQKKKMGRRETMTWKNNFTVNLRS